jgi:hypothetical protein
VHHLKITPKAFFYAEDVLLRRRRSFYAEDVLFTPKAFANFSPEGLERSDNPG